MSKAENIYSLHPQVQAQRGQRVYFHHPRAGIQYAMTAIPISSNVIFQVTHSEGAHRRIDCVELIDHLLKTDRKIEQEAVEASFCVKTLELKQITTLDIRIND